VNNLPLDYPDKSRYFLLMFIKRTSLLLCLALAWPLQVQADSVTLRIGTYVPEQSVGVRRVIRPWMDAVTGELGTNVRFEEYWGGSLGRDPFSQYELVRHGVLDIAWVLPSYTPGVFPQIHIAELPNLARTSTEASLATWAIHEQGLLGGTTNVHVIGIWTTDISNIHSAANIRSSADIKNLRIRTAGAVQADFISAMNAAPQTLDAVETNEALQRGTIDGLVQAWTGMRSFRTERLSKSVYKVPAGAIPFLLLMNQTSWEALSPQAQGVFTRYGGRTLALQAGDAYDQMAATYQSENAETRGYAINEPSEEDQITLENRSQKLHQDWIAATPQGQEAFNIFQEALADIRTAD